MKKKEAFEILIRYFILIALGSFNLTLFYTIFTPLTVNPVFFFISKFSPEAILIGKNLINFSGIEIKIIPACVAGAAYYLLTILNLTTPMNLKKRLQSILFILSAFLVFNVIRILFFTWLVTQGSQYFDLAHNFVWYLGSTALLVAVWFINIKIFKIKAIPVYDDFKKLYKDVKKKK